MKLSYQNIAILAELFEGIGFVPQNNERYKSFEVGGKYFDVFLSGITCYCDNKFGGIYFNENTTVSDFKALCAYLGVELVEKKTVCKNCGHSYETHVPSKMCPTQFSFYKP